MQGDLWSHLATLPLISSAWKNNFQLNRTRAEETSKQSQYWRGGGGGAYIILSIVTQHHFNLYED